MGVLLQTKRLTKNFGALVAAKDLNIKVHHNEMIAVIGANGAGKTTFINMVTGYLPPTSGRILFRDRDITSWHSRRITKLGIGRSFQLVQLFSELTVLENMLIAFSMASQGRLKFLKPLRNRESEERSMQVLEDFNIQEYAHAPVSVLAQGVRKLLDIAMAMVSNPAMLLLDEPTSGVAVEEKFPLMDAVMAGIANSGSTVLFVEHDMEIVTRYAQRVIAFYDGCVIADAPAQEAMAEPEVRELIIGEGASHA